MRELLHTKKLSNHDFLVKVRSNIYERSERLKDWLIQKSHQLASHSETVEKPLDRRGNTHQRLLSLIGENLKEKTRSFEDTPRRVYWRYTQEDIANSYRKSSACPASLLYVSTSCQRLFQILAGNLTSNLLQQQDIRICEQGFATEDQFECGVSLKVRPEFSRSGGEIKAAFWQGQVNSKPVDQLAMLPQKDFMQHVSEIFFQSPQHYHDFKALLYQQQKFDLVALLSLLESKQQIIIQSQSLSVHI